jgi:hypothetical protein
MQKLHIIILLLKLNCAQMTCSVYCVSVLNFNPRNHFQQSHVLSCFPTLDSFGLTTVELIFMISQSYKVCNTLNFRVPIINTVIRYLNS